MKCAGQRRVREPSGQRERWEAEQVKPHRDAWVHPGPEHGDSEEDHTGDEHGRADEQREPGHGSEIGLSAGPSGKMAMFSANAAPPNRPSPTRLTANPTSPEPTRGTHLPNVEGDQQRDCQRRRESEHDARRDGLAREGLDGPRNRDAQGSQHAGGGAQPYEESHVGTVRSPDAAGEVAADMHQRLRLVPFGTCRSAIPVRGRADVACRHVTAGALGRPCPLCRGADRRRLRGPGRPGRDPAGAVPGWPRGGGGARLGRTASIPDRCSALARRRIARGPLRAVRHHRSG